MFVNCVDDGFRLKLFLESFGLRAALLNAELPLNSRSHILAAFNKGLFDYLIATGGWLPAVRAKGWVGSRITCRCMMVTIKACHPLSLA